MKYARDFRESARKALSGKWGVAVGAGLVASLLGGGETGIFSPQNLELDTESLTKIIPSPSEPFLAILGAIMAFSFVFSVAMFILGSITTFGYARFNLMLIDGESPSVKEIFSFFPRAGKAIVTNLFRQLFISLWSLLFLIPGIIAMYNYAMTTYILAENPTLSPRDALRQSKDLMYGHRWRFFCMRLSFIGWILLGCLTLGIGLLWVLPYVQAATADFYREILGSKPVENPPEESVGLRSEEEVI